jgi:outer membrane murein-binding lipoprotein Lpp
VPHDTDLASTHVLTLNATNDRLTMDTTVSDEKGNAQYRQVFHRLH